MRSFDGLRMTKGWVGWNVWVWYLCVVMRTFGPYPAFENTGLNDMGFDGLLCWKGGFDSSGGIWYDYSGWMERGVFLTV